MKYLPILILILIQGFLFSCKKKEEPKKVYRLTPEDLTWNIYHVGDTIKFFSNHNKSRIYCVDYINQSITNPDENDDWESYEGLGIRFQRIDSIFMNNFFGMSFYRGYPGDINKGFLILIQWKDDLLLPWLFSLPISMASDTLTVNNINYSNVIRFTNPVNMDSTYAAKNIYYQKQKGWLRIEINSGEIWDRIN